jgi:hypothetical protein
MFTKYLRLSLSFAAFAGLSATLSQGSPAPATPVEGPDVRADLVVLQNEILNNDEEHYIVLGPNSDYFTGFDEAMEDVLAQLGAFAYTGDEATDFFTLNTGFMSAENADFAEGTELGRGRGTAYLYATVVLETNVFAGVRNPVAFQVPALPRPLTSTRATRPLATPRSGPQAR